LKFQWVKNKVIFWNRKEVELGVGSWKMEDGSWELGVGSWKMEDGRWKMV
jgi:hypothetical protein